MQRPERRGENDGACVLVHRLHLVRHQTRVADVLPARVQPRFIHNRAVFEKDDPVGIRGDARIMCDHHHGASPLVRHLPQQRRDLVRRF